MTLHEFRATIANEAPPAVSTLLQALWHDARGDWEAAHGLTQDIGSADAAWVHAYLHRKEGDPDNANYWYRRAGRPPAGDALEAEWARIAEALLARHHSSGPPGPRPPRG